MTIQSFISLQRMGKNCQLIAILPFQKLRFVRMRETIAFLRMCVLVHLHVHCEKKNINWNAEVPGLEPLTLSSTRLL